MTLAEKILQLRTVQSLSQGDLAERLEVSRQSVSKWETGQSVPDLDKIIKLADLFEITVDELVREDASPEPEQPAAEPQVIYVEKRTGLTPAQITGISLMVFGGIATVLGLVTTTSALTAGLALIVLGLPLLLACKHPWLICGWILVCLGYAIFNPYWVSAPRNLPAAARKLILVLRDPELLRYRSSTLFGIAIAFGRSLLTVFLVLLTARTWYRRNK